MKNLIDTNNGIKKGKKIFYINMAYLLYDFLINEKKQWVNNCSNWLLYCTWYHHMKIGFDGKVLMLLYDYDRSPIKHDEKEEIIKNYLDKNFLLCFTR